MLITLRELIDIVIMTAVVGYIFMDFLRFRRTHYTHGFDWESFKFACLVTAPALIFHELAHKFTAVAYGLQATFHAAYTWLGIGVLLKMLGTGFIFFVPGYVSIGCAVPPCSIEPATSALIAFAGPGLNLVLFLGSSWLLKHKKFKTRTKLLLYVTKQINLFLFIFNMLPIPLFDGFKVYSGLWKAFF